MLNWFDKISQFRGFLPIENYDWQYFFQDLLDFDDDVQVHTGYNFNGDEYITFDIFIYEYYVHDNFVYQTNFKENYLNFESIEFLKEPIKVLINRVETLGGKIKMKKIRLRTLDNELTNDFFLKVCISENIFSRN